MQDDFDTRIAARAQSRVGVPFRLHGRTPESGFDCIGLLADALHSVGFDLPIPDGYSLRGQYEQDATGFFQSGCFTALEANEAEAPGNIGLVRIAPRQLHFIIYGAGSFIHSHAALRRVVLTPDPVPWPAIGRWRYLGV